MKQSVLVLAILFTAVSCLKDDSGSGDPRYMSVKQYVAFLKAGEFNFWTWGIPVFEISDIPELLKHARSEHKISIDMNRPWSSTWQSQPADTTVGWMVLWIIEGTRLDVDYPASWPAVIDDSGYAAQQSHIAGLYEQWWNKNKDKTAEQLKEISPLEGTGLKWAK